MAIVINGSGTVTGLAVGGLPDDTVDEGSLANSINTSIGAKLPLAGGTMTGNLEVTGSAPTIRIKGTVNDSATSGRIEFKENDNTNGFDLRYDGSANNFVINSNNVANALVIARTTGRVGIGTNSPSNKLHVKGTGAEQINLETTGGATTILAIALKNSANTWQIENGRAANVLSFRSSTGGETIRSHANGVTAFNSGIALGVGLNNTASNVLSDYEEGTYIPTLTGTSSGSFTTTAYRHLAYTKIGRVVHIQGYINVGSESSCSGAINMSLPFTASSSLDGDSENASINVMLREFSGSNLFNVAGSIAGANMRFVAVSGAGGAVVLDSDDVDAVWNFRIGGSYIAA